MTVTIRNGTSDKRIEGARFDSQPKTASLHWTLKLVPNNVLSDAYYCCFEFGDCLGLQQAQLLTTDSKEFQTEVVQSKVFFVCNSSDLEPLDLLNGLALG